jgi:hypothetical protein
MTEFNIAARGAGKTHDLVTRMLDNPDAVCVTFSHASAEHAFEMAARVHEERAGKPLGRTDSQALRARFVPIDRVRDGHMLGAARRGHPIYVDNAELVFAAILGDIPHIVTATGTILEGAPE